MVATFPSVTWPSHTTLVTGVSPARHGLVGNGVFDRATGREITYVGDPELTKSQSVHSPTIYDVAHAAGLKTAGVIWPATAGASTLDWAIPDTNRKEVLARHTTPGLADELDKAGIPIGSLARWGWQKDYSGPRDLLYARVTEHLLLRHRPNLTLLHLVTPDGHQHNWGPRSDEAYWAVGSADDRIRQIYEALQSPGLAGKSTLIVVSDHGFAEYDRLIYPNVLLKELGLEGKARFHAGIGGVYLLDRKDLAATAARLKEKLAAVEGVDRVFTASDFPALGLPDPEKNTQMADIMLSPRPGYSFSNDVKGGKLVGPPGERRGTHGHLPDQPFAHSIFVAAGAGIKHGVQVGKISSKDVAPTIAALLGVKMPEAEGRVLREILK
jgi:predicted AlkP superfamily pyrophosphatase or phosphodiesterase